MSLTLVTGPANAEKAGHVLDAFRGALAREPLLVVPTSADVEHYRRELAAGGAVFGVQVLTFAWLTREIGRRAGVGGRPLGRLSRERVAAAAAAATPLRRLRASASTPGFVPAFLSLVDELEEARVEPGRWYAAVRAWAAGEPAQAEYAEELGALYGAYRDALRRLDRPDPALRASRALDALRVHPRRWGGTPLFLYGFDDLTRPQLDAIETLAVHCGADVTVSLTYEPGRAAFAGRGATFQELLALGAEHVALPARDEHYAAAALHGIERGLFEPGAPKADPGDAVLLLEGGGERAELELVAAHVARLIRDEGYAPDEIAVVLRSPHDHAALLEHVFADAAVPVAIDRRLRAGHTALGRGLLGLLRSALAEGSADDLLAWLRTPGKLERPALADRLEADARRTGAGTAAAARALWEAAHPGFELGEVDRLVAAHGRGAAALCERLAAEAAALFAAPWRGRAPVLGGAEALDARVAGALRGALTRARRARRARPRAGSVARRPDPRHRGPRGARGRRRRARRGGGDLARADPRAARARAVPVRPAGGRLPAARPSRAVPRRRRAARDQCRLGAATGARRGGPRRRALPLLRGAVAAHRPARAVLARRRRRG